MAEQIDPPGQDKEVSAPNGSEGLDILGTDTDVLKLRDGTALTISAMKMKQVRQFLRIGTAFLAPLQAALSKRDADGNVAPEVDLKAISSIDQDAFMQCVAIGSGLTVEQLDDLYPDDFVLVVGKIIVMNLDFFAQTMPMALVRVQLSVVTAFHAVMGRIEAMSKAGSTPSPALPATESAP